MRILICANRDLMALLALNRLWPCLKNHDVDLVLSRGIGRKGVPIAPQVVAWQTHENNLVERVLPRTIQKIPSTRFRTFEQLAVGCLSKSCREFPRLTEGDGLAYARAFQPDLVISIRFGQIFKPPFIGLPSRGILNLHSGVLPDYRGVLATFWAMLHGEREIGTTLHYVNDGTIDTGPIISIHRIALQPQRSLAWNIASLYDGGIAMLRDAIERVTRGEDLPSSPQSLEGRYFSYPTERDTERFLATSGHTLYSSADYDDILSKVVRLR